MVSALAVALVATSFHHMFRGLTWYAYALLGIVVAYSAPRFTGRKYPFRRSARMHAVAVTTGLAVTAAALWMWPTTLPGIAPVPPHMKNISALPQAFADAAHQTPPLGLSLEFAVAITVLAGLFALLTDVCVNVVGSALMAGMPLLTLYAIATAVSTDGVAWWSFAASGGSYLALIAVRHLSDSRRSHAPARSRRRHTRHTPRHRFAALAPGLSIAAMVLTVAILAGGSVSAHIGHHRLLPDGADSGHVKKTADPMTRMRGYLTEHAPTELMRIHTNDPDPYYLRATTLDRFSTHGWTQSALTATSSDQVRAWQSRRIALRPGTPTTHQHTDVTVTTAESSPYLPIYANPTHVNVDGDWRWDARSETIFSTRRSDTSLHYSFDSTRVPYSPQLLTHAPHLSSDSSIVRDFTDTDGPALSYVRHLVQRLVATTASQYAAVMALHDYFSPANGFSYSEATQPGTSGNDLLDFLQNKKGYCEQYASTMAYLARVAGIPARVAIGFSRGQSISDSHSHTGSGASITTRDAHAWVEIYFSGLGWVPFDPTPAAARGENNRPHRNGAAPTAPALSTKEGSTGPGDTSQNAHPTESRPTPPPTHRVDSQRADKNPQSTHWLTSDLWWAVSGAIVLIGAFPGLARWQIRRGRLRKLARMHEDAAAILAWRELVDTATDVGTAPHTSDTPRGFATRLTALAPHTSAAASMEMLTLAVEQARYAPTTSADSTRSSGAYLARAVANISSHLIRGSDNSTRLRARLMPRSVFVRAHKKKRKAQA